MDNPFLKSYNTPFQVPPFDQIKNDHFLPALEEGIKVAKKEIEAIITNEASPTFENTIEALERSGQLIEKISSVLFNINSAETSDELQEITQKASPLLTTFDSEIKQNVPLFKRIKEIYNSKPKLNKEQNMLLNKTYKSFIRSGADLNNEDKKRFREVSVELSKLGLKFGENVLAETNKFELLIDHEDDLKGLPADLILRASKLAEQKEQYGKWIFTLQAPSYVPFMEHADNRALRERMYKAYMTKSFKHDEFDNQELVKSIIKLRSEKAALLGYSSYCEYVLEERMAENSKNVNQFLDDLLEKAKPHAENEVKELVGFMKEIGANHELERWDWSYYSEKLRKKKYDLDDELIKPYFKLENVIEGVFKTAEKLYGLHFNYNETIPVYQKEVKAYEVLDLQGELVSIFYTDFFPRKGKRPGAWMTSFRHQKMEEGVKVIPIVSIVCNFTPSSENSPSLLKFDEVTTLFHEFGHALHGMLANTSYASLSGTSVYWDFVELPSQIFENWAYERECLELFAHHYETGELIPDPYIKRIKDSSNYHEAYATLRQLSFGMLDMEYHSLSLKSTDKLVDVSSFENGVLKKTDLFPTVEGTNMSVQFSHIFAGGYASGYYSYKWAEVLDADAFSLFKEKGIFDKETAQSFKNNILSKGGTEPPMELYKRFRGKDPSLNALLKRAGLIN